MNYTAYPKYKPSAIDWLGDIPDRWEVKRLKYVSRIITGNTPSKSNDDNYSDEGLMWVKPDNLFGLTPINETKEHLSEAGSKLARLVPAGTPLVCCIGTVGKLGWSTTPVATNQQINAICFLAQKVTNRFGLYLTASLEEETIKWSNINVVAIINSTQLGEIRVPLPPLPEQRAIADFLDRETAKIDTLVAKKRALIERLKEKRTALISHAVTRGINPNAKLKPSGIDWLGDIPEHWNVKRIKHLGSIRYGLGEPPEYVEDGLPFIRATDIKRGKIDLDAVKKVNPDDVVWSRKPQLKLNEILIVRSGAYTGDSAIVTSEIEGCIAGYDMVLTIHAGHPPFIAWALLSKYVLQGQIYLERLRAAQPHLNAEELGGFIVLVPPISEQRVMANYLDSETAKIDRMVAKVETAIERLQEYRMALITAAVTGKIDVRRIAT